MSKNNVFILHHNSPCGIAAYKTAIDKKLNVYTLPHLLKKYNHVKEIHSTINVHDKLRLILELTEIKIDILITCPYILRENYWILC